MKNEWVKFALDLATIKADMYTGCRKILHNINFTIRRPQHDLYMEHCGFTKSKMSMLVRNYMHEESHAVAVKLWEARVAKKKYGSVGFTTYNHFVKGSDKRSKRASVMGPCIQSVTLTYVHPKKPVRVDVFYRTTELFKKFPADLVFLRDVLLPAFKLEDNYTVTCHFANVTLHPMYFVTMLPLIEDPISTLRRLKTHDKYFHDWIVKWTARYVCEDYSRGIQKFAQAMRVKSDALARIKGKSLRELQTYLRKNHPGHRNEYEAPEEDEE